MIAGLSGDTGKTVASLSLLTALRRKGLATSVFKKGPDYIDAAWLSWAGGGVCRNLDTYMAPPDRVAARFARHAPRGDIAVIEGNRGLFDGFDAKGTHSSAALARLLGAPVILVVNATKTTRTLAAMVKGCQVFDPEVDIAGVILNRVAGKRHAETARAAIEQNCRLPVLGVIPKLADEIVPGRHLGLVTPAEFDTDGSLSDRLNAIGRDHLELEAIEDIAQTAQPLEAQPRATVNTVASDRIRIGCFFDSAFTFYYPENLEALQAAGAELVPVSSLGDEALPDDLDALYIGGGFPETHAARLAANGSMKHSVRQASRRGMPIWAECGGLVYLSRSVSWGEETHQMSGVFDVDLVMNKRPAGHGYVEATVDRGNPVLDEGTVIRGHEFHYTRPIETPAEDTCWRMARGVGVGSGRDGLIRNATVATYSHLHSDGVPSWAPGLVTAALHYRAQRRHGVGTAPLGPGGRVIQCYC
jgi:cobyrinic acid a,c-diamide synthase